MGGMIIRLRVHPNGDEKNFKRLVINLDDLTKKTDANDAKMTDAFRCLKNVIGQQLSLGQPRRLNVKRLFQMDGTEIKSIDEIEHDLELWYSSGEAFKPFASLNIAIRLDLISMYKTDEDEIQTLFEGHLQKPKDELPEGATNTKTWKPKMMQGEDMDNIERLSDCSIVEKSRIADSRQIDVMSTVVLSYDNTFMYPSIQPSMGNERHCLPNLSLFTIDLDPEHFEQDSFEGAVSDEGESKKSTFVIASKAFPALVLDIDFEQEESSEDSEVFTDKDYRVKLSLKGHDAYSPSTGWQFTESGHIINAHLEGYALTRTSNGILMKKRKNAKSQSWSIKTRNKEWENTSLQQYRRQACCWPLNPNGQINEEYQWPLEGELIAGFTTAKSSEQPTQMLMVEDKPIRLVHVENTTHSKWVTLGRDQIDSQIKEMSKAAKKERSKEFYERKVLLDMCTSELALSKPARRIWLQEYGEKEEIKTYDELSSRSVIMVSTKAPPKTQNKDSVEANLGNINHDLKLIESFIECRKELSKKMFVTPEILRHGHAVEIKPRAKCFKDRLDYEQREKERVSYHKHIKVHTFKQTCYKHHLFQTKKSDTTFEAEVKHQRM